MAKLHRRMDRVSEEAEDARARRRCIGRWYTSCIAVQSDDRNDSNHRLTSGIRHSSFRVATPAAIVAVYDCRARSPSLSFSRFPLAFALPFCLLSRSLFSSLLFSTLLFSSLLFSSAQNVSRLRPRPRSRPSASPGSSRSFFASLSDHRRRRRRRHRRRRRLSSCFSGCALLARPLSILRAIDRIPECNDEAEIYVYAFACTGRCSHRALRSRIALHCNHPFYTTAALRTPTCYSSLLPLLSSVFWNCIQS